MKKAVIIGAGPAGLTAAYELIRSGDCEVTVIEESDTFGGISRTVKVGGNRMDIGGHRFFSKDARVTEWWENMLPLQGKPSFDDIKLGREKPLKKNGPDPEATDDCMLLRRRVSRIYYKRRFFDYPVSLKWDTIKNMGLCDTVAAGFSYIKASLHKLPETSLENFYINRFGKKLYSMFFEGYTEKLWGRHPSEISAEWGAQRVKGLSISAVIKDIFGRLFGGKNRKVETSLIEQFIYPKLGPGELWEKTAKECEKLGAKFILNSRATRIMTDGNTVTAVEYTDKNGEIKTEKCDYCISSMPLCDLIKGMSDIPQDVRRIAEGLPYRDFVTVGMKFSKLDLVNKTDIKTLGNIVPDCWIYVQEPDVALGRIQIFNNWSAYMVEDAENSVFLGLEYFCAEGDRLWNMSEEEWTALATDELIKMGVVSEKPLFSHVEKVKKAYPAYFDTYAEIDKLKSHLDTYENLFCIGRNGQHRYNNMDHSMVTAFEAVNCIKNGITDKTAVWNVNTETEYHEEK